MANEKRLIYANELLAIGSKTKLIEIFPNWKELPYETQKAICKYGGYVKQLIQQLPTVEAVEVVHGRWKYYHKQNIAVCTNCSFERDLDANFGKAVSCPNCGAKMDG